MTTTFYAILFPFLLCQPELEFTRVEYNNPGLVVDLGVGLWAQPLPMDFDEDGDYDMVVATNDVPYNGIYFFENPTPGAADPIFKPGVRIGAAIHNITVSFVDGMPLVLTPALMYPHFLTGARLTRKGGALDPPVKRTLLIDPGFERVRANQSKLVDFDGDGVTDLINGLGVWDDYGWDDAFDERGNWTRGPLHGYVYIARNTGTNSDPAYTGIEQLKLASDEPLDVYGAPSPNFEDWDGDGDLDLICGSFLDTLTYFENTGTRTEPSYAPGRQLPFKMDLQMLQVIALDWDRDGGTDLIIGQEDGRVAWARSGGEVVDGLPAFDPPRFFRQEAHYLKIGALCTPVSVDWDGDGDEDLISGDTAGYLNFVENLDGGNPPRWAPPVYLKADGETIRIQAGPNGSIQGPAEAKWGYTAPSVADWDRDGDVDILTNSIWGKVVWFERDGASLSAAQPVLIDWDGEPKKPEWNWWNPVPNEFVTQWRTTPFVTDLNGDGLSDLVMLDHEGYLAFFERLADGFITPGRRVFRDRDGEALRLNDGRAGKSGRRKFLLHDWTGDGTLDLLVDSKPNIDLWEGSRLGEPHKSYELAFTPRGPIAKTRLAGHTTSPTLVDWDGNGVRDLLVGAEDGHLYHLSHSDWSRARGIQTQ